MSLQQAAHAAPIYSDDFDTDTSANYNTFITPGASGPSSDVTWAYDYNSQLGIPTAPHSTGGTTKGVRLRVDNLQSSVGTIVGAVSIATKNISSLPAQYVLSVDVWSNYIGSTASGLASSGSNGSTGVTVGVATAGTSLQYVAGNDGLMVEAFGDNGGGANGAYRVYTNNVSPRPVPTNSSYYAAGTSSTSASNTDPYYNFLTAKTAPSAQTTSNPSTQFGSTAVGTIGFAWHTFTITKNATNYIWAIDGTTITTVPIANITAGGNQVSLGNDDTGLTGSSVAANQLLNAEIFDNLTINAVPEPSALAFLGLGSLLGLRRRR
jgi:hypothetical protein